MQYINKKTIQWLLTRYSFDASKENINIPIEMLLI